MVGSEQAEVRRRKVRSCGGHGGRRGHGERDQASAGFETFCRDVFGCAVRLAWPLYRSTLVAEHRRTCSRIVWRRESERCSIGLMAESLGEALVHDGVTEVWRVGPAVHRSSRPCTATVHAFLRHVRSQGLDVPEPLGFDSQGREVLSFVEGDVPDEPVPDWVWADQVLAALAGLIRRLHDAAAGWEPPTDAIWGSIPGQRAVVVPALFDRPELVGHRDYCPGNVVFRQRLPAALIDFDLAGPTTRVVDCVNAMRWWVPLVDPADRRPVARGLDAGRRLRVFADAYGMSVAERAAVVAVAVQAARNTGVTMAAAADADPVFARWWNGGLRERTARAERWVSEHAPELDAALV